MPEYIESICRRCFHSYVCEQFNEHRDSNNQKCHFFNDHFVPIADVAPVVRCQNCIHAEPLDRNCELNTSVYMHCKLGRGEEEKNVWHKYKKYYKDYSLVDRDGFCDMGERNGR